MKCRYRVSVHAQLHVCAMHTMTDEQIQSEANWLNAVHIMGDNELVNRVVEEDELYKAHTEAHGLIGEPAILLEGGRKAISSGVSLLFSL